MSRKTLIIAVPILLRCKLCSVSADSTSTPTTTSTLHQKKYVPTMAATWKFGEIAIHHGKGILESGGSAVDAIVEGIKTVELDEREQYFVGVGGLPNADGVMELDAAIMDHKRRYGAVMALRDITTPIAVARVVMDKSEHNIFAGEGAFQLALKHGFKKQPEVLTQKARAEWLEWKEGRDNSPSPHDTIGMVCIDDQGRLAAGTSTSGWKFKQAGRIGDSPLIGSGLYCDGRYGAAVATGDGEEIMRTCLSFIIVEQMRQGKSPQEACVIGIDRMLELSSVYTDDIKDSKQQNKMHTHLVVGVVAMDKNGNVGAASTLWEGHEHRGAPYFPATCWRSAPLGDGQVHVVNADNKGNCF